MLRTRASDLEYCSALQSVMEDLEEQLKTPYGYSAGVEAALKEVGGLLERERRAMASAGYSDKYSMLISQWRADPNLKTSHFGLIALNLLDVANRATRTVDEVGWESAQVQLGCMLLEALEDVHSEGESEEREAILELVRGVLSSRLCAKQFLEPLLEAHPLANPLAHTVTAAAPKLDQLVRILQPYEGHAHKLRGIVFVQTRSSVRRVVNFIKAHALLRAFVRPVAFCGHAEMSSRAQNRAREQFDRGSSNLLIATSVAEEGLNVVTCNLVIMLDSVTTGRALVQCRGRARAPEDSHFHMCYTEGTSQSTGYRRSQQQESHMAAALQEVATRGTAAAFLEFNLGPNPVVQLKCAQMDLKPCAHTCAYAPS